MSISISRLLGVTSLGVGALALTLSASAIAQDAPKAEKAEAKTEAAAVEPHCGPAGNHALLERMTAAFGLSCEQKDQLEPYLHDEESVSKPLLSYGAFTPEEKAAFMLKIKIAARNQIKPLLTPEQQKKMDDDIESVSKGGNGVKGDSGKGGGAKNPKSAKKAPKIAEPFEGEEALCAAVNKYSALSAEQKREMTLQVKQAARREGAPQLTPDQEKKIDADIQQLSVKTKASGK
jgi:Spy/CpxP family protein refolding chaperone